MIRASLLALFSTLICGFCGKEFESLGRHSWRCKSKVGNERESTLNVNPVMEMPTQMCLPVKQSNVAVVKSAKELAVLKCTNEAVELLTTLKMNCNNK
jgi:hypothetical protein